MSRWRPRVAFFTDSFHEVNGVALTSRQFQSYARRYGLPMFSCHAGPEDRTWSEGSVTRCEWRRSGARLAVEADLAFDLRFMRHRRRVREALAAFDADLVHITGPNDCSLLALMVAHDLGLPVVASWHTNVHEYAGRRLESVLHAFPAAVRNGLGQASERISLDLILLLYKAARIVFAPNPELIRMLSDRLHRPAFLMSRGIDVQLFDPAKRCRSNGPFRIGFVGRLSREKGVDTFPQIEQRLRAAGRINYEFVFVGDGSQRGFLERNMLSARCAGIKRGEELAAEYANLDAFLFPSQTDTFGNVVLEALASGVPVLTTASGGPQYLIEAGDTGFVCPTPGDFAARVMELMDHPEQRAAMSSAAREQAIGRYSWDSVFAGVYRDYENLWPHTTGDVPVGMQFSTTEYFEAPAAVSRRLRTSDAAGPRTGWC